LVVIMENYRRLDRRLFTRDQMGSGLPDDAIHSALARHSPHPIPFRGPSDDKIALTNRYAGMSRTSACVLYVIENDLFMRTAREAEFVWRQIDLHPSPPNRPKLFPRTLNFTLEALCPIRSSLMRCLSRTDLVGQGGGVTFCFLHFGLQEASC
jgi:hypothetical protein